MPRLIISLLAIIAIAIASYAARTDTIAISTTYVSPAPVKAVVITPDAADTYPAAQFPTVYLLNGFGGDHRSWSIICPELTTMADRYAMILVMPDGRDSWYFDSPVYPAMQMESFITRDLVPYIDSHYPTIANPHHRAITGLSMGGHGGLYLMLRHPDIWLGGGSTSGGVNIEPFPSKWKIADRLGPYETNKQRWHDNTVINMLDRATAGMHIIVDCGTEDFFYAENLRLHQAMLDRGIAHDFISRPGTHCIAYWRNSILYQLLFFNSFFSAQ